MKSERITKSFTSQLSRKLVDRKIGELFSQLDKDVAKTISDFYEERFGEFRDKIKGMPESWFPQVTEFRFYSNTILKWGIDWRVKTKYAVPASVSDYPGSSRIKLDELDKADRNWIEIFDTLNQRAKDIRDLRSKEEKELTAIISSFTTTKKLYEAWPEIISVAEMGRVVDDKQLPVSFNPKKLNLEYKLPPEVAEHAPAG